MKKINKIIIGIGLVFLSITANAQSVRDIQERNARATGYAIVASRNPGKSFSVFVKKWDGVNDLEYNANNQINPSWHAQAVIKGNFFNQTFDGNDFTAYSSVIVSQEEFDIFKSTGTDWWIICSNLPPFSNSNVNILENGNVGVGRSNPLFKLDVNGVLNVSSDVDGGGLRFNSDSNSQVDSRNWLIASDGYSYGDFAIRSSSTLTGTPNEAKLIIKSNGNVGIGVKIPTNKLDVNGTIHSQEVRVDMDGWSDFVFKKDYALPTLEEVGRHIAEKGHLENIPSEKEVLEKGINLGEMNSKLLQKIEEMTLYMIEQDKENKKQSLKIESLEKENEAFELVLGRLSKIEEKLQEKN